MPSIPISACVLAAAIASLFLSGCGGNGEAPQQGGPGQGQMPPPPVTATTIQLQDVDVQAFYAGRIRGMREVEVRARVGGILEERLYEEGQFVEQGSALFRIEREPYEIALQQAEAEIANALANLNQAEREWRRVSGLYEQNAVSERERDRALSDRELAEARMKSVEARRDEAQLNLDYTTVTAPISGPTGLETLSEGSLIDRGALLTTIVQHDPVQVRFSLPERDAATQRAARQAMVDPSGDHRYKVRLIQPDGRAYGRSGIVDFTDSTIDGRTGTVRARAVFANPDGDLIPGQFVRVQLSLQQLKKVFAINPRAVSEGAEGPRVFILHEDDTVEARNVTLGPVVDGRQVVLEGLNDGDKLIVNGHVSLQPGMTVAPEIQDNQE